MKKVLIRVESYVSSGVGGLETRIYSFTRHIKNNYTFLTNNNFLIESRFFKGKNIFSRYNTFSGILKDIFSFRNYDIIDSNGLRDNIVASLNFLIFFLIYKIRGTKLFLTIHGNQGIEQLKGGKKIIYNLLLKVGFFLSSEIIVVSEELKLYLIKKYKLSHKKIKIIPNYIYFGEYQEKVKNNKAVIISRLDNHKIKGILQAIDFCIKNNIKVDIYGGGDILNKMREKYKNEKGVNFLGFKRQEEINYEQYYIIFAMGRALLEGFSNNLIPILIGYDKIITKINSNNYKKIKFSNFSGRNVNKEGIDFQDINEDRKIIFEEIKKDFDIKNLKDFY